MKNSHEESPGTEINLNGISEKTPLAMLDGQLSTKVIDTAMNKGLITVGDLVKKFLLQGSIGRVPHRAALETLVTEIKIFAKSFLGKYPDFVDQLYLDREQTSFYAKIATDMAVGIIEALDDNAILETEKILLRTARKYSGESVDNPFDNTTHIRAADRMAQIVGKMRGNKIPAELKQLCKDYIGMREASTALEKDMNTHHFPAFYELPPNNMGLGRRR